MTSPNLQRARDIAADASAKQLEGSEHHDPENTMQWLKFMREGAYDSDAIVQAVLRALDEPLDPIEALAEQLYQSWLVDDQGGDRTVDVVILALRRGIEIGKEQAS